MAYDKNYGNKNVSQPGGGPNAKVDYSDATSSRVERSYKVVTAPCRPGPARPGGNKPTAGMLNRRGR